jgi:tyrosinase
VKETIEVTAVRRNILSSNVTRESFVRGVTLLKQEDTGKTTADMGIAAGTPQPLSTYDLFVIWHHRAMSKHTPPDNQDGRNAAHRGPIFLPWHRLLLLILEQNLQRILHDSAFGLPYWDWAADGGDLPETCQPTAPIWGSDILGSDGDPIKTGPFRFQQSDPTWRVRVEGDEGGDLSSTNRGLRRVFAGSGATTLPTTSHVKNALALSSYDEPDWSAKSGGFRNRLEGCKGEEQSSLFWLHNQVHVWVGGDMIRSTSPNDPVFYLNHCNVDRCWEAWMRDHGRTYLPDMTAGADLEGHRIDDPMVSPLGATATPRRVLDLSAIYTYDVLP